MARSPKNANKSRSAKQSPARLSDETLHFASCMTCTVAEDAQPLSSLLDALADLLIDNAERDGTISPAD